MVIVTSEVVSVSFREYTGRAPNIRAAHQTNLLRGHFCNYLELLQIYTSTASEVHFK